MLFSVVLLAFIAQSVVLGKSCNVNGRPGTCLGPSSCSAKAGFKQYSYGASGVSSGCRYEPGSIKCCAPVEDPPKSSFACKAKGRVGSCTSQCSGATEETAAWNSEGSDGACKPFPSGVLCCIPKEAPTTTATTTTTAAATTTTTTTGGGAAATTTKTTAAAATTTLSGPACTAYGVTGACVTTSACSGSRKSFASLRGSVTGCESFASSVRCCAEPAPEPPVVDGPACTAYGVRGGCVDRADCPSDYTSFGSVRGSVTGCETFASAIRCCAKPLSGPSTGGSAGYTAGGVPLAGVELIKQFEGLYLKVYPDPLSGGRPYTVGYGSTRRRNGAPFRLGERISKQEAEDLLIYQLETDYMPYMARRIPTWKDMNSNQRGALVSFGYNLGKAWYGSSSFRTLTRVVGNKALWRTQIRSALLLYRNPGTNVEAGLRRRRNAEADLFLRPVSGALVGDNTDAVESGDGEGGLGAGLIVLIIFGVAALIALVGLGAYFVGVRQGTFNFFAPLHESDVAQADESGAAATVYGQPADGYSCDVCSASFDVVDDFATHIQAEHPDEQGYSGASGPGRFECAVCQEAFDDVQVLQKHVDKAHY
eukprot:TRINITY_DN1217_c0_g2_i5.p2 TRINITY_DN1217_c0_g2~~TRINITY_DN1217_c0_g2_i5.p2  ORF type:complete len:594 (+),score=337.58 TRINITY_DN1217_c0_g2_i5:192-1973(+)